MEIQGNLHSENTIYTVLYEQSNNTASFVEHLKFQEKSTFADAIWLNCSIKKTRVRTLYILKLLQTEYSTKEEIKLRPPRSTLNFKKKLLLYRHIG